MEYIVGIGERKYLFEGMPSVVKARAIYAQGGFDQNGFETEMERQGLDFTLEMDGYFSSGDTASKLAEVR